LDLKAVRLMAAITIEVAAVEIPPRMRIAVIINLLKQVAYQRM
jgi:hypothetical protein